jgi:hypothetical protein
MSTTPRELLDTSIAQLELLRAFLGEQLGVRTDKSESTATSDVIACQEILVSLGALILRVQATSPESGALGASIVFAHPTGCNHRSPRAAPRSTS